MNSGFTLYEIEDELVTLIDTLDGVPSDDEEIRAEIEQAIIRAIQARGKKVDRISHMLSHFEFQAELAAVEAKRLQTRRNAFDRSVKTLEDYVCKAMLVGGVRKLEGDTTTLALRASPVSVQIFDFEAVPGQYKEIRTEVVISKDALKRALKAGAEVPGAALSEGNVYLVRK
jgi:hypothetical protein